MTATLYATALLFMLCVSLLYDSPLLFFISVMTITAIAFSYVA